MLGPFHRSNCSNLNSRSVHWISSNFPGLDSSGCSAFRISNISFVSLNSVPFLCGDNSIHFSVEKTVETESTELQKETEETELNQVPKDVTLKDFSWRENALSSGSGPVLLLHMPLHLRANNYQDSTMYDENPESIHWDVTRTESRGLAGVGPYELWHTLPPNATEYIFQALKPRLLLVLCVLFSLLLQNCSRINLSNFLKNIILIELSLICSSHELPAKFHFPRLIFHGSSFFASCARENRPTFYRVVKRCDDSLEDWKTSILTIFLP